MNGLLPPGDFVRKSLELHLFLARIMEEHSFFMEAGFVGKDTAFAQQGAAFKSNYTEVLREAITLANGVVTQEVLNSGEYVTDKTLRAEHMTQELSGIVVDSSITIGAIKLAPSVGGTTHHA